MRKKPTDHIDHILFKDSLRQEFKNNMFAYYSCSKTGTVPEKNLNEGLNVFLKLSICRSLSLFLLNEDTFEFSHTLTLPEFSAERANEVFYKMVESGAIANAISGGNVTVGPEDDAADSNSLIIPIVNTQGVAGLILMQISVPPQNLELELLDLFKIFACHLAVLIKFSELQADYKIMRESREKELTIKMNSIIQSKKEISRILDSLQTGVFIIDKKNSQILDANAVASTMLGISKEQLIGTNRNSYCGCDQSRYKPEGVICADIDNPGCTIRNSMGSSNFIIKKVTFITLGDNEEYYLESFMDATERRLAELELQKMKDELEQRVQERTASLIKANELLMAEISENKKLTKIKSEFLSLMSHEIRTPVNSILNFTTLLRTELEDKLTPFLQDGFNIITRGGLRLIRTVDLILNVADVQTDSYIPKFEDINLHTDIIRKYLSEFSAAASFKNIELLYENNTANAVVRADRHSVSQIFLNILDNAVKFTEQGRVEIELRNDSENNVILEIKDSGIGISEEYMPQLFTLFSQEDQGYSRRFEGNGLGLALVKKYCGMNNAIPEVRSRKGEGTIVTITFRLHSFPA